MERPRGATTRKPKDEYQWPQASDWQQPNFFYGNACRSRQNAEEIGIFRAEKYFNSLEREITGDVNPAAGNGKVQTRDASSSPNSSSCKSEMRASKSKIWSSNRSQDSGLSEQHKSRRLAASKIAKSGVGCKWSPCSGDGAVETEDAALRSVNSTAGLPSRSCSKNSSISSAFYDDGRVARCGIHNFTRFAARKSGWGSWAPESQGTATPAETRSHAGFNSFHRNFGSPSERSFNGDSPRSILSLLSLKTESPKGAAKFNKSIRSLNFKDESSPDKKVGRPVMPEKGFRRWRINGLLAKPESPRLFSLSSMQSSKGPVIPNYNNIAACSISSTGKADCEERPAAIHEQITARLRRVNPLEDDPDNQCTSTDEPRAARCSSDRRRYSFTFPLLPPSAIPLVRAEGSNFASESPARVDDPFGSPFSVATCRSGDYRRRADHIKRLRLYTQERTSNLPGGQKIGLEGKKEMDDDYIKEIVSGRCSILGDSHDCSDSSSDLFDLESFAGDGDISSELPVFQAEQQCETDNELLLSLTAPVESIKQNLWINEEEEIILEREDEISYSEEE